MSGYFVADSGGRHGGGLAFVRHAVGLVGGLEVLATVGLGAECATRQQAVSAVAAVAMAWLEVVACHGLNLLG